MAKYTITYACGHTAEMQLYGKESDRQKRIAWYATIDCPDCETNEAARQAAENGYPILTGSEKQVAWANKIRNKAVAFYDEICKTLPEKNREAAATLKTQWLSNEVSAAYWIDNRDEMSYKSELLKLVQASVIK